MDGKDMSTETFIQTNRKYTYTKKIDRSFAAAWEGKTQPPPVSHHQYHRGERLYLLYLSHKKYSSANPKCAEHFIR